MNCPVCHARRVFRVRRTRMQLTSVRNASCILVALKHPGKEWYQSSDNYGGTVFGTNTRKSSEPHPVSARPWRGELVTSAAARAHSWPRPGPGLLGERDRFRSRAVEQAAASSATASTPCPWRSSSKTDRRFDVVTFFEVWSTGQSLEFMSRFGAC